MNEKGIAECTMDNGDPIGKQCGYGPDVFLMSILLFIGTFTIAIALKMFRHSGYLPSFVSEPVIT